MKHHYTKTTRKADHVKQKNLQKKMIRHKDSARLTTNYSLMLQLYLLEKEEATNKFGVRLRRETTAKNAGLITRASLWLAGLVPFSARIFDYFHRETNTSVSI